MENKLPKKHFSYSQLTCWQQSKDTYRSRYYEGQKFTPTREMEFGKTIATHLETQNIGGVKRFRKPEHYIEVDIEGYTVMGYIDSFCPRWKKFLEYKTSRTDVVDSWTKAKVQKHKQLDFYSVLIQEKYEKVHDECELIVLKTTDQLEHKGRKLKTPLRLTGEVKTFKRKIEQWERDFMKKEITKTIKEIEEDYKKYLYNKKRDVPF